MAKAKTPKAKSVYDDHALSVLRHAYGNIAGTVYPLPEGADEATWREAIATLEGLGLLHTSGAEPALTENGRNICRALSARDWRWG